MYDCIGKSYSAVRLADATIVARLHSALSTAAGSQLLDVAAGTGNYSKALAQRGWKVTALEPSAVMRAQRRGRTGIDWVAGVAEGLPFRTGAFDAVSCVSALHHLRHWRSAICEMNRVAGRGPVALFTRDPRMAEPCWMEEYFPEVWAESHSVYPPVETVRAEMTACSGKEVEVALLPLPATLSDWFASAGWNRPEMYLDERVRAGMSPFARTAADVVSARVDKLRHDLANGLWDARYGALRRQASFQAGYYLVVAR